MSVVPSKIEPLGESVLPVGYKKCAYLESTGTQWIDTEYKPNNHTQIAIRCYWVQKNINDICTYHTGWNPSGRGVAVGSIWNGGCVMTSYICNKDYILAPISAGVWVYSAMNMSGKSVISTEDGVYKEAPFDAESGGDFQMSMALPLFRGRSSGVLYDIAKGRCASLLVMEYDKPVLNLIPALDKASVPCMFDTVRSKPLYNKGSGQFLYELA